MKCIRSLCDLSEIGEEFHYMFCCTDATIKIARIRFIEKIYYTHPNVHKFSELFKTKKNDTLRRICKFLDIV